MTKPECPEWCAGHVSEPLTGDAGTTQSHRNHLFERYPPNSRRGPAAYALELGELVMSGDLADYSCGPSLSLTVFDSIPVAVYPEDARAFAAALIRGAEIVEASRTATCPECSRKVHPTELAQLAGVCLRCLVERSRRRRAALRMVP